MKADISVGILSYNRPIYLREALLAVLSQTVPPEEITIFDNASGSEVYESIKDLLGTHVQWQGSEKNHPVMWNIRRAARHSQRKYVVILHDDDRICPNFIEEQISFLDKNPDVGVSTCNGYYVSASGKRTGSLLRDDLQSSDVEVHKTDTDVALIYAKESCIPFACAVYRREIFDRVDVRDEFGKVIDAVLFCEIAQFAKIVFLGRPLYEIRQHGGQDSSSFAEKVKDNLDAFLWNRDGDSQKVSELRKALQKRYTFDVMVQALDSLRGVPGSKKMTEILKRIFDKRFSFKELFSRVFKRIFVSKVRPT